MAGTHTFTIIKPCAVGNGHIGGILHMALRAGFNLAAMRYTRLTQAQAAAFYEVHKERPFYADLVEFMTSGPVVVAILEKENAVADYRALMGATDPAKAADGTIRKAFATDIQRNAVHGSDSDENAVIESNFFFAQTDRFSR